MNGHKPRKRPESLGGRTPRMDTGCGHLYLTVNFDDEGAFEVFTHLGKSGQCGASQLEALSRCISAGLRSGVDPAVYIKQLKGIKCPNSIWSNGEQVLSCADAMGRLLEGEIENWNKEHKKGSKKK